MAVYTQQGQRVPCKVGQVLWYKGHMIIHEEGRLRYRVVETHLDDYPLKVTSSLSSDEDAFFMDVDDWVLIKPWVKRWV